MKPSSREGFSLLEVLMATSILLGSVIVLNQLAEIGRKNAADAQDLSTAQLLCETRLNELIAGLVSIEAVDHEPFVGAPGWILSVDIDPLGQSSGATAAAASNLDGLAALRVTVARDESEGRRNASFTLVRWIPDPNAGRSRNQPAQKDRPAGSSPDLAGNL